MDYLSAIKVFADVAETESIRKSAKKLCKTEAAVSKKLKKLEQYLGVSLITRDGKNMSITPLGKKYLQACNELLTKFDDVQQIIKNDQAEKNKVLKICCDQFLFQQYVLPKISELNQIHKQAQFEISSNKDYKNIKKFDLIIASYINDEQFDVLVRKKIGNTSLIICASPNYLKQHPNKSSKQFSTMNYIQDISLNEHGVFDKQFKLPIANLIFDNHYNAITAAINNLGFTISYEYMIKHHLESGNLIEIARSEKQIPINIYYNKDSNSYLLIKDMLKLFKLNMQS
jgi:DNA-binding transcriptional LysR family regulator